MQPHEPANRAERRATERAAKKLHRTVKMHGRIGIQTHYVILNADGHDVTSERITPQQQEAEQ